MKIFNVNKQLVKSTRDIIEKRHYGKTVYHVVFKYVYLYQITICGKVFEKYTNKVKNEQIIFAFAKDAEWYAKNCVKPSKVHYEPFGHTIYLAGDDKFSKYGYFNMTGWDSFKPVENMHLEFCINFNYRHIYGSAISLDSSFLAYNRKNADYYINLVLSHCNNFESENIIKSFDVITLETLPIDKLNELNASSKEIEELKKITEQFHKDQLAYAELTKKLLEK
ncbi:MAG: hypothetical protein [Wendovervirus sonii]|uniref:Uncharacterized protein n=1 Tax=phage Lak_Megaphage_Sonny TaxID=3109229 RepID=A0ABZ0Z2Y1_9CAUD|nr:MAG: hypothetical protein [phage Lak_Megaphage_Sonny]